VRQIQTQNSVESFGWQWTEQTVYDSTRTFHRRLFKDIGIWFDYLDEKIVADICSGNGRHVWALNKLTQAKKIISVELSQPAVDHQVLIFSDNPRIQVIQGDAVLVQFQADFIYMIGAIQHTSDPEGVLRRMVANLSARGELVVSFYMVTPATMAVEPIRWVTKRLPKRVLWWLSPLLAPLFMVRKTGREMGFANARHTAYDWFGSHEYQRYFREAEILGMFRSNGIHDTNVIKLQRGLYKIRKGQGASVDDEVHAFGAQT
jgi:2-polyprenyl-3-methyl-5-hydroxy-6-metoxy-1,4-benzoquinol methylase